MERNHVGLRRTHGYHIMRSHADNKHLYVQRDIENDKSMLCNTRTHSPLKLYRQHW